MGCKKIWSAKETNQKSKEGEDGRGTAKFEKGK